MIRIMMVLFTTLLLFGCNQNGGENGNTTENEDVTKNEEITVDKAVPKNENEDKTNAIVDESEVPTTEILLEKGIQLVKQLKEKDFHGIAEQIHTDKGVRFSPYGHLSETDMVLTKEKVKGFMQDENTYDWGRYDGKGTPIQLTPKEYYEKFIFDKDYLNSDEVIYNKVVERGNTIKNVKEKYPNGIFIEYYKKGTVQYDGMDWASLTLVFEEDKQGDWSLVAVIHDQWTI